MRIVDSKNIFINTDSIALGTGNDFQINLPQAYLRCEEHQRIKVVLESFEMSPRCFYLFNITNSTFFLRHAGVLYPVYMPQGDYTEIEFQNNLLLEINNTLLTTPLATLVSCSTSVWNISTGLIELDFTPIAPLVTNPAGNFISAVFLNIYNFMFIAPALLPAVLVPVQALNTAVNSSGLNQPTDLGFQDFNEAIGGIPTTDPSVIKAGLQETIVSPALYTLTSYYPAKLQTLENLYLRCSLPGNNLATKNYLDDFAFQKRADESEVLLTQVFAKFPVPRYDRTTAQPESRQAITFLNTNDNFFINLQKRWLTTLQLSLTDDKGRLIPAPNLTALQERYFQYSLTLGFQIIEDREAEILEAVSDKKI